MSPDEILRPKKFPRPLPPCQNCEKTYFFGKKILLFRVIQENFFHPLKCIEGTWVCAQKFFQNFPTLPRGEKLEKNLKFHCPQPKKGT